MDNPFDIVISKLNKLEEAILKMPHVQESVQPEIITTEELCKRLSLSQPTVIAWRKRKAIPFLKIGSSIRYNWPTVVEALEKKSK